MFLILVLVRLISFVILILRGQARVHSKWFLHGHTPFGESRTDSRSANPLSRLSSLNLPAWGYGRRTEKVRIFMQHRAGGITSGAENAVCRIIEGLALLGGLNPLLLRDGIVVD